MPGVQRRELPRWEALDLLRSTSICRICIVDHGCPVALPMNFRVIGDVHDFRIVLRAARDTAVGGYVGPASLEADEIHLDRGIAWSVIVRGELLPAMRTDGLLDPAPMLQDRHEWLLLEPASITGRRFTFETAQDSFSVDWDLAPA
jgi:nitroimidazol reductase NimA-like FMN-containing flavoprotein (pyridoxamine 5'-phosphate oxidase superfamily)